MIDSKPQSDLAGAMMPA